uniref:Trafficking protein particle complex subunit 8 n=1 Tax=Heterorhabditis bacteriophora TaxID=37862 RepID=A0A1I7XQA5_HETBA
MNTLQALTFKSTLDESLDLFSHYLHRWAEPVEQETLRTYLACIFIVAGCEENPLSELSKLIQMQHTQQHSSVDSKAFVPSHCSVPKWTTPNTLKHYILLHDAIEDNDTKTTDVYNQMCTTYGTDSCQLFRIGLGTSNYLPDVWRILDEADIILERGLQRAVLHATASHQTLERKISAPSSVATISPSYAVVHSSVSIPSGINGNSIEQIPHRQRIACTADSEMCSKIVEKFLKDCLVPHVERLMRTLNDQLTARRGIIGKSLTTGMRKWFGSASGGQANNTTGTISYTQESPEMQSRRLADLAFQFGLYTFAHLQYRSVKKEFENDQAWLYHATALEMSAVALQLSSPSLSAKQFPIHYFEDAMKLLLKYSGCVIYEYFLILKECLSYMVICVLECYRMALPAYFEKHWNLVENHLSLILAAEINDYRLAVDCSVRLLRSYGTHSEENLKEYIDCFIRTQERFGDEKGCHYHLPVPLLEGQATRVICGERPITNDVPKQNNIHWIDIERAAFHAVAENQRVRDTPPAERFRVEVVLRNPLVIPLCLRNVKLGIADVVMRKGYEELEPFLGQEVIENLILEAKEVKKVELWKIPCEHLDSFRVDAVLLDLIGSNALSLPGHLPFELRGKRLTNSSKQMKSTIYAADERLRATVASHRWPLLDFRMVKKQHYGSKTYCGQAIRLVFEVENIGHEPVSGICIATDGIDCVSAGRIDCEGKNIYSTQSVGPGSSAVRVFNVKNSDLDVANKKRLFVTVRAPQAEVEDYSVGLLFFYCGISGAYREWRTALTFHTHTLFEASARVLDEKYGLVSVNVRNRMAASDAALARIDVLRIRVVSQMLHQGEWQSSQTRVSVQAVKHRSVQLDCEQSDNICLRVCGQISEYNNSTELWMADMLEAPDWPAPYPRLCDDGNVNHLQFAILWKASVVNNEGQVSSLIGESFIPDPFSSARVHIPGLPLKDVEQSTCRGVGNDGVDETARSSIIVSCRSVPPVQHNFSVNRLCEIPLSITVINVHKCKLVANVIIRFVPKVHRLSYYYTLPHLKYDDTLQKYGFFQVREAVLSVHHLPPENRQQWWVNREISTAVIHHGKDHTFNLIVRVAQPSVYDLAGSQLRLETRFDGDKETKIIKVPSTIAIVNAI